jgi:hypothetical protein
VLDQKGRTEAEAVNIRRVIDEAILLRDMPEDTRTTLAGDAPLRYSRKVRNVQ